MTTPNFHINADYQDNCAENPRLNVYEAMVLMIPGGEVIRFETNDPVEDYKAVTRLAFAMQRLNPSAAVFLSSDVGHFVMDVAGYRWNEYDLIEENPKSPPIIIPEEDRIDLKKLSQKKRVAVAVATEALNTARQTAYRQSKGYPALRHVFIAADTVYREHCVRFGQPIEIIFDEDHYRRERRACGDALCEVPLGRKGIKA